MQASRTVPEVSLSRLKTACSSCSLRELCLPVGLSEEEMSKLDSLVFLRRPVKRGDYLFRAAEPFSSLYAARTGFFKTKLLLEDGREQVTGFTWPAS
jgi:CRP/FNR family transcriptional regulator